MCVFTRGLINRLDHQTANLQPHVKQRDWRRAACCLPEAPRLCLYGPNQSTEQQEAFSSIVYAQLDYMHFKWTQTELNACYNSQEIIKCGGVGGEPPLVS